MTSRLSKVASIVNESQTTFVPGKHIHDHILLAYELIRGYTGKHGTPRRMLQMDLQKVYDTVECVALESVMRELGFPSRFIQWIMVCVSRGSYRYMVNDAPSAFMKAKTGLR